MDNLHFAESLLADLDMPDPKIDIIWHEEAQDRLQAYKVGGLKTVSYKTVMQKYK
jgi:Putative addiction module component